MSTKSTIIYIDQDGSHIFSDCSIRGQKHDGIVGFVDLTHVKEVDNNPNTNNIYIKFRVLMNGYFKNNTLHLWHSDLISFKIDDTDLIFEIKEDSALSEYFFTQLVKR